MKNNKKNLDNIINETVKKVIHENLFHKIAVDTVYFKLCTLAEKNNFTREDWLYLAEKCNHEASNM